MDPSSHLPDTTYHNWFLLGAAGKQKKIWGLLAKGGGLSGPFGLTDSESNTTIPLSLSKQCSILQEIQPGSTDCL